MSQEILYYTLPSLMTVETAEVVAAELKQLPIADKVQLTIDASSLEQITTPGLQLLVSLEKTIAQHGGIFRINGARESFLKIMRNVGLESLCSGSSH